MPPDLRRQVERRLKDADKAARSAIKQLQVQVRRASTRADVNSVLKRIDGLTRQAREIATGTSTRARATRPRTSTRRATAARTRKAAPARRAAPNRKTSTARAATTRRSTTPRRRRAATAAPDVEEGVIPVAELGEVEVYEITER